MGLEVVGSAGIKSAQTPATGTDWAQIPEQTCKQLVIYNDTGTTLRWCYCDSDGNLLAGQTYLTIPDGVAQPIRGINNASRVLVKRDDESNTRVLVRYLYEKV